MKPTRQWNRLLWGIDFSTDGRSGPWDLIGDAWVPTESMMPYPGEPRRALLFCSRQQARDWCSETMARWRDSPMMYEHSRNWIMRPVRVRETVRRV